MTSAGLFATKFIEINFLTSITIKNELFCDAMVKDECCSDKCCPLDDVSSWGNALSLDE